MDSVKGNSVGSGYVSHCWTSAFDGHFNHCFVILKKCNASHQIEKTSGSIKHNRHCVLTWSLGLVMGVLV